jgi:hypothetical protein
MLALREMIRRLARGRGNILILSHGSHGRDIENSKELNILTEAFLAAIVCRHVQVQRGLDNDQYPYGKLHAYHFNLLLIYNRVSI